ncbi:MAG TPA: AAA family ATPase [Solirubrobacterales bacterium]|nr:AAA family ATPase [Solirubrobacterales bacterium]
MAPGSRACAVPQLPALSRQVNCGTAITQAAAAPSRPPRWNEPTAHLEPAWWDRLSPLLNDLWPRLLEHGVDVILDFGFWTRRSRGQARALALAVGAETRLYAVVCADEVAKARCLSRNAHPGWSFSIGETAFEALRAKLEPVGPDEAFELVDTTRSDHR